MTAEITRTPTVMTAVFTMYCEKLPAFHAYLNEDSDSECQKLIELTFALTDSSAAEMSATIGYRVIAAAASRMKSVPYRSVRVNIDSAPSPRSQSHPASLTRWLEQHPDHDREDEGEQRQRHSDGARRTDRAQLEGVAVDEQARHDRRVARTSVGGGEIG